MKDKKIQKIRKAIKKNKIRILYNLLSLYELNELKEFYVSYNNKIYLIKEDHPLFNDLMDHFSN